MSPPSASEPISSPEITRSKRWPSPLVTLLVAAGLGATPAWGASPAPGPDAFAAIVDHVAGGDTPSGSDLDLIWAPVMAAAALDRARSYVAPSAVSGYAGGQTPDTPCAIGTSVRAWRENARYCGQDATIRYDVTWLRELSERFGAFAPAAVLAHEWGHHVQGFLGTLSPGLRAELEADCFAGMYLGETEGITSDGTSTIREDDLRTALFSFFALGDTDYRQSGWFQPGVHGSPQQRILAFTTGYVAKSLDRGVLRSRVNGLDWCMGYREFEPGAVTDIGPYRLLGPPGRPGAWAGDTYVIPPRPEATFASSDVAMRWFPASEPMAVATQQLLTDRLDRLVPGAVIEPLGALAVRTGTGVAVTFQGPEVSGVAALVVPVSGEGALVIAAFRSRSAASDMDAAADFAAFLEQAIAVNEMVIRLCAPGESPDPSAEAHNAVCMSDVQ